MNTSPEYPAFKEISLEDASFFNDVFREYPLGISELTFTNLFMWRNYYRFVWTLWDGFLCIMAHHPRHQPFFLPPVGDSATQLKKQIRDCIMHLRGLGFNGAVQRVPEALVAQHFCSDHEFEAVLDRDNADYVYLCEDLIKLPGNRYHRKKNQISHFKKSHTFQYHALTPELVPQCLALETHWCDLKHCDLVPSLSGEEKAIHEALANIGSLTFQGGTIVMDGTIEAFTLGEALSQDTAVIHVEKANPAFEGLYQVLNQMFMEHACASFTYVNREQDLGEEGLRQAKQSYLPHHLINKYTLRLKP